MACHNVIMSQVKRILEEIEGLEFEIREQNVLEKLEREVEEKKKEARKKLKQDLNSKKVRLDSLKVAHEIETSSLIKKIEELQLSLKGVQKKHQVAVAFWESEIRDIKKQLNSSSLAGRGLTKSLEREFDCPVCYEVMGPPRQIFQCVNGHLICNICKNHPTVRVCPCCRISVTNSQFSRNLPMERLARNHVGGSK